MSVAMLGQEREFNLASRDACEHLRTLAGTTWLRENHTPECEDIRRHLSRLTALLDPHSRMSRKKEVAA